MIVAGSGTFVSGTFFSGRFPPAGQRILIGVFTGSQFPIEIDRFLIGIGGAAVAAASCSTATSPPTRAIVVGFAAIVSGFAAARRLRITGGSDWLRITRGSDWLCAFCSLRATTGRRVSFLGFLS